MQEKQTKNDSVQIQDEVTQQQESIDKTQDTIVQDTAVGSEDKARQSHAGRRKHLLTIALMALSIAMMTIGAYINIPIGTIKVTMQFLVSNTICLILGKKIGGLSVWLYIVMGLIGLPIFSNFSGGLSYVLQPSYGFLIGFAVGGQIAGFVREKINNHRFATYMFSSLIGLLVLDILGVAYGAIIMYGYMGSTMSVWKFLMAFLIPFIPIDIIKCAISSLISKRLNAMNLLRDIRK